MTKTFSILFTFLFLVSCGKGGGGGSSSTSSNTNGSAPEIHESELNVSPQTQAPAPVQAQTFDIRADLIDFNADHETKVYQAFDIIKRVVATDEFKKRVLNKTFNGKKTYVDNNGLTNEQIYKKILEASEKLTPGKNNTMDLSLATYFTNDPVIGYTMPNIKTIYMNRRYLTNFQPNEVAMNIFHEWLHKVGFKHSYENNSARPHSVPYAVGYIMRDLAKKY